MSAAMFAKMGEAVGTTIAKALAPLREETATLREENTRLREETTSNRFDIELLKQRVRELETAKEREEAPA